MSSKYKFEFTGVNQEQCIMWNLHSRLGQCWQGEVNIVGCTDDGDVHIDINVLKPTNTTIPKRGWDLIRWKVHRHVINSIKHACKNPEMIVA